MFFCWFVISFVVFHCCAVQVCPGKRTQSCTSVARSLMSTWRLRYKSVAAPSTISSIWSSHAFWSARWPCSGSHYPRIPARNSLWVMFSFFLSLSHFFIIFYVKYENMKYQWSFEINQNPIPETWNFFENIHHLCVLIIY